MAILDENTEGKARESLRQTGTEGFFDVLNKAYDPGNIQDQLLQIDKYAGSIGRQFGVTRENLENINKTLTNSLSDVISYGGEVKDIFDIQNAISQDLGRNVLASDDAIKGMEATSKVTGVAFGTLATNFKDIGVSASMISADMTKVVNTARELGVSAQKVSDMAVSNMKKMNEFNFQGGVEGLAKMAAQAVNLRVDMRDTLNFAEKMFDPEKAIEMAASMQRLGVAQSDLLDPLRLMELGQNDPTELQNQIAQMTKQFVHMNEQGKFELFKEGKLRLKEIAKELQIPYQTLVNMALSGAELDDKLKKIQFPPGAFTDEQQKFIANVAEMGKDGKYEIKIKDEKGETQTLGLQEGIKRLTEWSQSSDEKQRNAFNKFFEDQKPKTMEEMAKGQLTALESIDAQMKNIDTVGYGLAGSTLGKDIVELSKTVGELSGKLMNTLKPTGAKTKDTINTFNKIRQGIVTASEFDFEQLQKDFTDMSNQVEISMKENLIVTLQDLNNQLKELGENNSFGMLIKQIKDSLIKKTGIDESQNFENVIENLKKQLEDLKKQFNQPNSQANNNTPTNQQPITFPGFEFTGINEALAAIQNISKSKKEGEQQTAKNIVTEIRHIINFENLPPNINEEQIISILTKTLNDSRTTEDIVRNMKIIMGAFGLREQNMQPGYDAFGYGGKIT